MHAFHGIQWTKACIDRTVHKLAVCLVGHHDCAGSASTLSTAELSPGQVDFCKRITKFSKPTLVAQVVSICNHGNGVAIRHNVRATFYLATTVTE